MIKLYVHITVDEVIRVNWIIIICHYVNVI